jgi:CHASE3 domain sensor protein
MQKTVVRLFNNLPITWKLLLAAIIPLMALILLKMTTSHMVQTFSQDAKQLNSRYLTQQIAAQYLRLIVDMESGFRGYVLTKQDRYLSPYRAAREEIVAREGELEQLVAEEQNQKQTLHEIRSLAHQLVKDTEALIQIVKAGSRESAMTYLEKGRGLEVMVRIRGLMAEFDRLEQQRITTGLAQMNNEQTATLFVIWVGGLLTFGLMTSALYLIARSITDPLIDFAEVVEASSSAGSLAAVLPSSETMKSGICRMSCMRQACRFAGTSIKWRNRNRGIAGWSTMPPSEFLRPRGSTSRLATGTTRCSPDWTPMRMSIPPHFTSSFIRKTAIASSLNLRKRSQAANPTRRSSAFSMRTGRRGKS